MAVNFSTNSTGIQTSGTGNYRVPLIILTTLFFMWGFITCMNDILIPHLKSVFEMGFAETMLIQTVFFLAYALMSIPASIVIKKIGYQKGIVVGLSVAGIGAFLFYPASIILTYPFFLFAFFILATGITILQVAANPYVAILGSSETASGRLTLTQAFNSLGTTLAPLVGGFLILGGSFYYLSDKTSERIISPSEEQIENFSTSKWEENLKLSNIKIDEVSAIAKDKEGKVWINTNSKIYHYDGKYFDEIEHIEGAITSETKGLLLLETQDPSSKEKIKRIEEITNNEFEKFKKEKASTVRLPYIGLSIILLLLAIMFLFVKLPKFTEIKQEATVYSGSAWQHRHLVLGAIGIFAYVGAEVSIGSFLVNFFSKESIAGLVEADAAKYVALYWGGAMVGRFQGALAMNGIGNKTKKNILMMLILSLGFVLAWYITKDPILAMVFSGFVILNAAACIFGANKPGRTLGIFATITGILVLLTITLTGSVAMWSIIAVGLFNSIMFPTIFTLAIDGLGHHTSQGSGILNTAIVGGAILPLLMGVLADSVGVQYSFAITLICYIFIAYYGFIGHKIKKIEVA